MNSIKQNKHIYFVVIVASLLAIWPLPGTIALRQLLLIIGLAFSLPIITTHLHIIKEKDAWPLWILASFFLWLVIHLFFFSVNIDEQWHELGSDWLRSFIAALIGLSLGLVLTIQSQRDDSLKNSKTLELILFAGFSGTSVIFFSRYIYEILTTSVWIHKDFYMTPFKSKTPIVIFSCILLPISFIKILEAIKSNEKTPWIFIAPAAILLTLFSVYFANTKNGFIIFSLTLSAFLLRTIILMTKSRININFIIPITILITIITLGAREHINSNSAWPTLLSDVKASLDITRNENWKDYETYQLPTNEYGTPVNGSTYQRIAWARAGIQLITENPQGYGLIHHSFGALAIEKWHNFHKANGKTKGATHSAWIDFTLGLGIPGLLLVLIPLWLSFWRALHMKGFWPSYIVWTVPVIFIGYTITEVSSDHFIELLFFITAFFCGVTAKPTYSLPNCNKNNSAL